jgi:hypothetical protein
MFLSRSWLEKKVEQKVAEKNRKKIYLRKKERRHHGGAKLA